MIQKEKTTFTDKDGHYTRGSHNIALGGTHPHAIPQFQDLHEKRRFILDHTAGAFRVFGRKGYSEGEAGHISVRDPVDPKTFWINPLGLHFSLIRAADLVHVDEKGNILRDGNQSPINAAGFAIHSALHKARPDINAACHTHSTYGKAWSTFGEPVEMLNQDACIFYDNQVVYDQFGGVAIEAGEGEHIAAALGEHNRVAILQNHGLLTVGTTIDEAAYLFTLLEKTCEVQLLADSVSHRKKKVIDDNEAAYSAFVTNDPETMYASFQADYIYELRASGGDFLLKDGSK